MKRVLYVEDDSDLRGVLARALSAAGYKVEVACNGEEGLAAIIKNRPDLIILDLLMPQMSGQEMMHKVEELPDGVHIPVLVLTNVEIGKKKVEQISRNRPTWYLIKANWSLDEIVEKVGALLGLSPNSNA